MAIFYTKPQRRLDLVPSLPGPHGLGGAFLSAWLDNEPWVRAHAKPRERRIAQS